MICITGSSASRGCCGVLRWAAAAAGLASLLFVDAERRIATGAEPEPQETERLFVDAVQPFLRSYCLDCHGSGEPEGDLDLSGYPTVASVAEGHLAWEIVLQRVEANEMPPPEAQPQPSPEERAAVIRWIHAVRKQEAKRNAGDPGVVLARRLSNSEYNYTIRDLTGVEIRPTREFPVDPANEAGFDNSGESLAMSPALLNKYLGAAREVAEHLVLKPQGFDFAPHPVATDTDRDKYCVNRIVDFYQRQPTDYADYFLAAWRYHHRAAYGKPAATLDDFAAEAGISGKYLGAVWQILSDGQHDLGPVATLRGMWRELPAPATDDPDAARQGCEEMREFVIQLRKKLEPSVDNLETPEVHNGSQPLVLWKNRQYAANRRSYARKVLQVAAAATESNSADSPEKIAEKIAAKIAEKSEIVSGDAAPTDPDLVVPADQAERAKYEAAFGRFCDIFPDAFYVSERGRDYLGKSKENQEKGRLLSAGFHSMMGYFRDDQPLYEMVLNEAEQQELDALWQELDFITSAPMRQHTGFIWFERTDSRFMRSPEFDFARAEDKDVTSEAKIQKLAERYLAKVRKSGGEGIAVEAIARHFDDINAKIRWVEQARTAAEPSHLSALVEFAERAYRRPLTESERDDLPRFYRTLRERDGLSHEEAIQDSLISILMSPYFCYRMDLADAGDGTRPLSDHELASRLSYFLWSSLPDEELLSTAAAGELHRPEVLTAQVKRMLQDDRIRGLAVEFGSNWLDFRRFEEHNSVDRERFPAFTNELREAMFEEPIRFFVDLIQEHRPVHDFLFASHTFVNPALAKHYGMSDLAIEPDEWLRVDAAERYERGGLLPMSVFLTKNAPGLRTSPVKRGYWVARRLLGERIPPPPPNVPELPSDETKMGDLTLRETLERHREQASCASCHERFDSLGLVFEGYGPVGERRSVDLGGRPVETHASFPGSSDEEPLDGAGLEGLRGYLREHRQEEFLDNLCRKLLTYALGRGLLLSDDPTVVELRKKLAAGGYRFEDLVVGIVTSPQFLTKRGRDHLVME